MPSLGHSFIAFAIPAAITVAFLTLWLLGNDMKVLRTLMVMAFGDGIPITREWLQVDPRVANYRIFSFDAYRLAFYLSAGLIPLSLIGIWLGRRSVRLARSGNGAFGGYRLSRVSLALSSVLFLAFSVAALTSIPGALERGHEKRVAATAAEMYALQDTLQKYYREFGTYPQELSDLSKFNRDPLPQSDFWKRAFSYSPVSVIASKGHAIGWSNYKLTSAGPDGQFGNEDDLTMIDGVIISSPGAADLRTGFPAPSKPRR